MEAALTAEPGAYVLFIALEKALALSGTALGPQVVEPGRYAYCGSAYGAGGLRARTRRHVRPNKALHWHVDHLTTAGRVFALGLAAGGRECELVEEISQQAGAEVPIAGFGSSDCARCPAHLLRIDQGVNARRLALALGLVWVSLGEGIES